MPRIRQPFDHVALESMEVRKRKQSLPQAEDEVIDPGLCSAYWLQLSSPVVHHPNRAIEPERSRPDRNRVRVLRLSGRTSQNGIDRHIKGGVLFEPFEFPVQNLQALLRHLVRLHVIDTDLKIVEPGRV